MTMLEKVRRNVSLLKGEYTHTCDETGFINFCNAYLHFLNSQYPSGAKSFGVILTEMRVGRKLKLAECSYNERLGFAIIFIDRRFCIYWDKYRTEAETLVRLILAHEWYHITGMVRGTGPGSEWEAYVFADKVTGYPNLVKEFYHFLRYVGIQGIWSIFPGAE